ncbi:hypothetical protein CLAFUW4_04869 [Fulvia fulva]|uniref:Uncharacterized protein n=1 Tax=Passalora fulva TaxID=5499 RepID=A0A9Q8PHL6_PASFU|nr:uncharacterized protein CLAFUR5_12036 [Fulvia fulva]KAK4626076.1 hypothetical protein CLAFUR4_04855 [Fulvia fulva]KAK4628504.1 hypothetical protein CLAFUR0_04859 [Fulvia fulva]UJO22633.1 hypothetical protein CLAFUR5_12036 [Fulvia fulva]WPV14036.1 hypothetical protein CLAFUW4_04869 [Fulvia fulva]WPV29286.1 hypothetical protein CLAFUW7_04863 [Fulvia fulva]
MTGDTSTSTVPRAMSKSHPDTATKQPALKSPTQTTPVTSGAPSSTKTLSKVTKKSPEVCAQPRPKRTNAGNWYAKMKPLYENKEMLDQILPEDDDDSNYEGPITEDDYSDDNDG